MRCTVLARAVSFKGLEEGGLEGISTLESMGFRAKIKKLTHSIE